MNVQAFSFKDFVYSPHQRRLIHNGEPARVGSSALDFLATLLGSSGQIEGLVRLVSPRGSDRSGP